MDLNKFIENKKGDLWICTGCKDSGHLKDGYGVCILFHGVPNRNISEGKPNKPLPPDECQEFVCNLKINQNWRLLKNAV